MSGVRALAPSWQLLTVGPLTISLSSGPASVHCRADWWGCRGKLGSQAHPGRPPILSAGPASGGAEGSWGARRTQGDCPHPLCSSCLRGCRGKLGSQVHPGRLPILSAGPASGGAWPGHSLPRSGFPFSFAETPVARGVPGSVWDECGRV